MKLNLKAAISETNIEKSRHHIMVVDDEPGNLRTLERYLGDAYHVTCFESPQEALEKLTSHDSESKFSLIISDHIMPEMTGVEFLTKLDERRHQPLHTRRPQPQRPDHEQERPERAAWRQARERER